MLDFPTSPTLGQQFTAAGVTWTWDGAKWLPSGLAPTVVPGINDNRIINGDMRIDQRNNGASGTASGYTVDRWQYVGNAGSKGTWRRVATSGRLAIAGFLTTFGFQSSSAYTPAATDTFTFQQTIEADMISDFRLGNSERAAGHVVVLGVFQSDRNIQRCRWQLCAHSILSVHLFIPTANTWTKIVITIPGDTAGTWVMSGNAGGLYRSF